VSDRLSGTDEGAKTKFNATDAIIENFYRPIVGGGGTSCHTVRSAHASLAPGHFRFTLISSHRRLLHWGLLCARSRPLCRREFTPL